MADRTAYFAAYYVANKARIRARQNGQRATVRATFTYTERKVAKILGIPRRQARQQLARIAEKERQQHGPR